MTPDERLAQLQYEIDILNAREGALLADIEGCVGTRSRICGLSVTEAPNPWVSRNGEPCRGNATLSARFGDFCGYAVPPLTHPTKLARFGT